MDYDKNWVFPRKTILVDFDGTIGPFVWPRIPDKPYADAAEALRKLKKAGYTILIFTTRAWPGWKKIDGNEFYWKQLQDVKDFCRRWGIPCDGITHEKQPCMFIIDDRALNPERQSWSEIIEIIAQADQHDSYGKVRGEAP